ncbi:MAG: hypothetical protein ABSE59_05335 [Opitutaceae bacterium]|jgi:hypothetical protein
MKKFFTVIFILVQLLMTGCLNNSQPSSRPLFTPKTVTMVSAGNHVEKNLTHEHTFVRNGGGTILGGARITLLSGVYVLSAADAEGNYWRHRDRGIVRSGNLGMADCGGVFIPNDGTKLCEVWMAPHSNDRLVGLLGPAAVALPTLDSNTTVVYVGDIPEVDATEIRKDLEP